MSIPSYPTKLVKHTRPDDETVKREVITHYGHACACEGCSETRLSELTLDHISAGGNAQRRAMKRQGSSYYREVKHLIDAGQAPTDLQVLCRRCNLSKGEREHCKIHGLMSEQGAAAQGREDAMLSPDETDVMDQEQDVLSSQLVQFSGRCKSATKRWLLAQPKAIGTVVDDLVEEKRSGEATVLAEVRVIAAHQKEILAMLSDIVLVKDVHQPEDSSPHTAPPVDPYRHLRPELQVLPELRSAIPMRPATRRHWYLLWIA